MVFFFLSLIIIIINIIIIIIIIIWNLGFEISIRFYLLVLFWVEKHETVFKIEINVVIIRARMV